MSAREVLEQLQSGAAGSDDPGVTYDDRVRAQLLQDMDRVGESDRRLLEEVFRRRAELEKEYGATVPTRYQSLQDYARLASAKERVDATLLKVGEYTPRDNVVFGSVETHQLNAAGGFLPDSNEYLIVFNRGLLMALLAASNLVIVPLTSNPRTINDPVDDIDAELVVRLVPRFANLLESVSAGRSPSPKITIPVLQFLEKEMRWSFLEDAAMQFVLAHEYAHVLRGHLDAGSASQVNDDKGGWGCEYEADALALDFLVQIWSAIDKDNPLLIAFALQGACLFFGVLDRIEQYSAEMRNDPESIWTAAKTHPPTYLRWTRMMDKVRDKTPQSLLPFMNAQILTVLRVLDAYYVGTVPADAPETEAGIERRFQRRAMWSLARYALVSPHIFIAMRCARAALSAGAVLDDAATLAIAGAADQELQAAGARPLRNYAAPLAMISRELSELALTNARTCGVAKVQQSVDRLADVFLLDGRTRYPLSSEPPQAVPHP